MYARLCLLPALLVAAPASAGALDDATDAYADLNYEGCRQSAAASLTEPGNKNERVTAYKLSALCAAALGDTDAAYDGFVKMIAIDGEAQLPPGLSPRFTSSYLEAKGHWVGRKALELELFGEKTEGGTRVVRLIVHDEADLIARVAWQDDEQERSPPVMKAERMELEVPAEVDVTLVGLDEGGGVVVELPLGIAGREEKPKPNDLDGEEAVTTQPESDDGPPWVLIGVAAGAGLLLVAGAGAAVAAGVVLSEPSAVTLRSGVVFGNQ